MTVVVTGKSGLVVPKSIQRKARIKAGDKIAFAVAGRVISIIPDLPYADDTFTSKQTTQIAKARREMREGKHVSLAELEHALARKRPQKRRKTACGDTAGPA
jgi:bifunctional DNA-binding transcriptional regulator/antitoxin component of YhaV-PrlF toxin-antitoxin module